MVQAPAQVAVEPLSPTSARRDRTSFRTDVQGLRALAVGMVVLYHAGVPGIRGGYVGVDVFFVISGFVITGALLREREAQGRTSLLSFYGARARRILPAATFTIIATLFLSFRYLGFLRGGEIASDARSAALFVANFHFISLNTDYATATADPSPLQHFWSLAVEEQFYIVYPTLFILTLAMFRRVSITKKLAVVLGVIAVASYAFSVVETSSNAAAAYFSPFTRAWELALGGIAAVAAPHATRLLSERAWSVLTWVGIAGIAYACVTFDTNTPFPGSIAAIPVVGTALVIVAGTGMTRYSATSVLRLRPLQWLGSISFGLYLIHWPLLTINAQRGTSKPPLLSQLLLVGVAVIVATVVYWVLENPIRRSKPLIRRPVLSLLLVPLCISMSLVAVTVEKHANGLAAGVPGVPPSVASNAAARIVEARG